MPARWNTISHCFWWNQFCSKQLGQYDRVVVSNQTHESFQYHAMHVEIMERNLR